MTTLIEHGPKVYFYPHRYMRDRQLDTVRHWPRELVINPDLIWSRRGGQVAAEDAKGGKITAGWRSKIPLLNLKRRPSHLEKDVAVYLWGGVMATGPFIVDLDNPWSLVGYNLRAMPLYRLVLQKILASPRCLEIRCMSMACKRSLLSLFGQQIYAKATVHYPRQPLRVSANNLVTTDVCRFLFVATQFEIKGGAALLRAFKKLHTLDPRCRLDLVTHLPEEYEHLVKECPGISAYQATFNRDEISEQFMKNADVLVLPTYVDSFGMVALEALAHGLALICTDVYALREMVRPRFNGALLAPPISIWNGVMPSRLYFRLEQAVKAIKATDTIVFERQLLEEMQRFVSDADWRRRARCASISLLQEDLFC